MTRMLTLVALAGTLVLASCSTTESLAGPEGDVSTIAELQDGSTEPSSNN